MSLISTLIGLALLVLAGVGAYYRWKWRKADRALEASQGKVVELDAQNNLARERGARAEAAVDAAHERERNEDATVASSARTDSGRAADLLNKLRK